MKMQHNNKYDFVSLMNKVKSPDLCQTHLSLGGGIFLFTHLYLNFNGLGGGVNEIFEKSEWLLIPLFLGMLLAPYLIGYPFWKFQSYLACLILTKLHSVKDYFDVVQFRLLLTLLMISYLIEIFWGIHVAVMSNVYVRKLDILSSYISNFIVL